MNGGLGEKMEEILSYLQSQGCPKQIHAGVILGSGLGDYIMRPHHIPSLFRYSLLSAING